MRRALGKGLAQLMGEEGEGTVHELPVAAVAPSPTQPRQSFDDADLEELADSLRQHGVLQPILVRPVGHDRYEIMAGERRYRAALIAGLATVPVVVKPADARTALEYGLIENVQRVDIAPLEAASAYRRLVSEFGLTQEAVADRVGKSRVAIANTLRLLGLPAEVQDLLATGAITEGHAR
ncbi:MAG: ParB/RepB/Spo0J family partition protein, partial [Fimbriimonadaceae bacterium]